MTSHERVPRRERRSYYLVAARWSDLSVYEWIRISESEVAQLYSNEIPQNPSGPAILASEPTSLFARRTELFADPQNGKLREFAAGLVPVDTSVILTCRLKPESVTSKDLMAIRDRLGRYYHLRAGFASGTSK